MLPLGIGFWFLPGALIGCPVERVFVIGQEAQERDCCLRTQLDLSPRAALSCDQQMVIDELKFPPITNTGELFLFCHWVMPRFLLTLPC